MAEIQLLRSQNRELLTSNSEKDKQIRLYQKQLSVVKRALALTKKKSAAAAQSVSSEAPKRKNSTEDSSGGGAAVLQQNPTLKALLSQDTSITRRYGYWLNYILLAFYTIKDFVKRGVFYKRTIKVYLL